jgi:Trk K+ transport system NAD-binding subunit
MGSLPGSIGTPLLRPFDPPAGREIDESGADMHLLRDHAIVVGMNTLGKELVRRLTARGLPVLAVDTDPGKLAGVEAPTLLGNAEYLSLLEEAGLHRARLLISALHIEDVNRLLALRAQEAGIPAIALAGDQWSEDELMHLGVALAINPRAAGAAQMVTELESRRVFRP